MCGQKGVRLGRYAKPRRPCVRLPAPFSADPKKGHHVLIESVDERVLVRAGVGAQRLNVNMNAGRRNSRACERTGGSRSRGNDYRADRRKCDPRQNGCGHDWIPERRLAARAAPIDEQ